VVMTDAGQLIEVQGTAEAAPFSRDEFNRLLDLGTQGVAELIQAQKAALAEG
jgi:ribonuclease PH